MVWVLICGTVALILIIIMFKIFEISLDDISNHTQDGMIAQILTTIIFMVAFIVVLAINMFSFNICKDFKPREAAFYSSDTELGEFLNFNSYIDIFEYSGDKYLLLKGNKDLSLWNSLFVAANISYDLLFIPSDKMDTINKYIENKNLQPDKYTNATIDILDTPEVKQLLNGIEPTTLQEVHTRALVVENW